MNNEKALQRSSRIRLTADGVQNLTILLIFAGVVIVGTILKPNLFLTGNNFMNILMSSSSVIMVGAPVTLVLISGNLDLSVGGIGAMGAVLFSMMTVAGVPIPLALILTVLIGAAFGFACGYSISKFALPSFIISLAFSYICRGIALIGAHGAVVYNLPYGVDKIAAILGHLPLPVVYAAISVVIFMFIQSKTTFGSKVYAVGANMKAAKLSGINEKAVISRVFMMSGMLAAFAGVVLTARVQGGDSGIFQSLQSDCIIVAVLGGTDINGGRGTVFGMLIGALFIGALTNIMNLHDMTSYVQDVIKGVVLIFAILLNNIIRDRIRV